VTDNGELNFTSGDTSSFGGKISGAGAVVIDGNSRATLSASSDYTRSRSLSSGPSRVRRCSPAWVGDTLRVVRCSSRTPRSFSSARIAWLNAERDTPISPAARAKLRLAATNWKALRSASVGGFIDEILSTHHAD
jgi:hypothetical protein